MIAAKYVQKATETFCQPFFEKHNKLRDISSWGKIITTNYQNNEEFICVSMLCNVSVPFSLRT